MNDVELPTVISNYQTAHDRHDVDAALSTFAAEAVVHDEDQDWVGTEQIRAWLTKTSSEYTFTRTLLDVKQTGGESWLVRNRLEGNFPGGIVDLHYAFTLVGENIAELSIAP